MYHLGFTGSRTHTYPKQIETLSLTLARLRDKGYRWMHNGGCEGYDAIAAKIWHDFKGRVMLHPPSDNTYQAGIVSHIQCEPKSYLNRDRDIADCSKLLVACPRTYNEQRRSGTWATVRYALQLRRKVILIYPDGTISKLKELI